LLEVELELNNGVMFNPSRFQKWLSGDIRAIQWIQRFWLVRLIRSLFFNIRLYQIAPAVTFASYAHIFT